MKSKDPISSATVTATSTPEKRGRPTNRGNKLPGSPARSVDTALGVDNRVSAPVKEVINKQLQKQQQLLVLQTRVKAQQNDLNDSERRVKGLRARVHELEVEQVRLSDRLEAAKKDVERETFFKNKLEERMDKF